MIMVVFPYNSCDATSGQTYTGSAHYFEQIDKHCCSFLTEQYLFVQHHFVVNAANAQGDWVFKCQSNHSAFQHKSLQESGEKGGSSQ